MKKTLLKSFLMVTLSASYLFAENLEQLEKDFKASINSESALTKEAKDKIINRYYSIKKQLEGDKYFLKRLKSDMKVELGQIKKKKDLVKQYKLEGKWSYTINNKKLIFAIDELGQWSDNYEQAPELGNYDTSIKINMYGLMFYIKGGTSFLYKIEQKRDGNCLVLSSPYQYSTDSYKLCRATKENSKPTKTIAKKETTINKTLLDTIKNKDYFTISGFGETEYKFNSNSELLINNSPFKINLTKDNKLSLYNNGNIIEKANVSIYKDEAILLNVFNRWGDKVNEYNVFIKKDLLKNPRECPSKYTTIEAYKHIVKRDGRIHCSTIFGATKKFYAKKILKNN